MVQQMPIQERTHTCTLYSNKFRLEEMLCINYSLICNLFIILIIIIQQIYLRPKKYYCVREFETGVPPSSLSTIRMYICGKSLFFCWVKDNRFSETWAWVFFQN